MQTTQHAIASFVLSRLPLADQDRADLQADLDAGCIDRTHLWDMWSDLSAQNQPELWQTDSLVEQTVILCQHFGLPPI